MNTSIAGQLLSKVMSWSETELADEAPWLQFMASMKYDSYDQYMPGTRFLASLVQWLLQFNKIEERRSVYNFLKTQLIFVSSTQMSYLVHLLYNTKIRSLLIKKVAAEIHVSSFLVGKIEKSDAYKACLRQSLVVGLSDGAHIDILRRYAGLNNDQVLTNYYPDSDKTRDMLKELKNDDSLRDINNPYFEMLFLLDDFTASGTSFIRKEGSCYKGKIVKVIDMLSQEKVEDSSLQDLFDKKKTIDINVLFCIATEYSLKYLVSEIKLYLKKTKLLDRFHVNVDAVQIISDNVPKSIKDNKELCKIADLYLLDRNDVLTKSYRKGKCDFPYLGYNEGALPIVLSHNTPNNSLPILWQFTTNFKGLFPRVNRHIR